MNRLILSISILFLLLQVSPVFGQFDIPPKPEVETSVYDDINLLSNSQKEYLESKLIRYADTTSTQILVAIISTTNDDDIGLVATQWGEEWGVGQADEDNGIVILLAKDDREIDISTGYGIEYRLTDIMAERIVNRIIIPEFKNGDFYSGLDKGTDAIIAALNGEFDADPISQEGEVPIGLIIFLFITFIIFIIALSANRRNRGGRNGGNRIPDMDILEAIIFSNMGKGSWKKSSGGFGGWGGSSGGSFGGSSGGFSGGFGGGSFGGGGASGSW